MIVLTNTKAQELNDLFHALCNYKGNLVLGMVPLDLAYKQAPSLGNKDLNYIRSLVSTARRLQNEYAKLFSGNDNNLAIYKPALSEFLEQGGFISVYKKQTDVRKRNLLVFILVILGLVVAALVLR
jgi:hypothetical protein